MGGLRMRQLNHSGSQNWRLGFERISSAKNFSLFGLFLSSALFTDAAHSQQVAMIANLEPQNRACVARAQGSTQLNRQSGVTVSGAQGDEQTLIDSTIARINALAGNGGLRQLRGLQIRVRDTMGRPRRDGGCLPASQLSGAVEIARRCAPGARVQENNIIGNFGTGLLAHEIGHYVGNRGGYNGYPVGCHISQYTTHTLSGRRHAPGTQRNEEFAEVFAAYVLQPERLRQYPGCQAAFNHMRRMFGGRDPGNDCGSGQGGPATMMADRGAGTPARAGRPGDARTQVAAPRTQVAAPRTQVAQAAPPPSRAVRAPASVIAAQRNAEWPYFEVDTTSAQGFLLSEAMRRERESLERQRSQLHGGRRPAR